MNLSYRPLVRLAVVTAALLAIPAIAMQFTAEVQWSGFDFAAAGTLIFGSGALFQWAIAGHRIGSYRLAAGVGLAAAFLMIWINLAVGIIGSEGHPGNAMYLGVLAVAAAGSFVARWDAAGMARAFGATAAAQVLVSMIALRVTAADPWSRKLPTLVLNLFFVAAFAASALLFHRASRRLIAH